MLQLCIKTLSFLPFPKIKPKTLQPASESIEYLSTCLRKKRCLLISFPFPLPPLLWAGTCIRCVWLKERRCKAVSWDCVVPITHSRCSISNNNRNSSCSQCSVRRRDVQILKFWVRMDFDQGSAFVGVCNRREFGSAVSPRPHRIA